MQSVAEYFQVAHSGLLAWALRVNSAAKLAAAVADKSLHMLEADVHLGQADATPLIAEPGAVADLTVAEFIQTALAKNKGIKLDFHAASAVEPTLRQLQQVRPATPVVLHADIFALLNANQPAEGLEPEQFIQLCQHACPRAVISLGWSLKRSNDADGRMEALLIEQIAAMLQRLGARPQAYGVEIRAGYTPGRGGGMAEHGAALLLDPIQLAPAPQGQQAVPQFGGNVISLQARLRGAA